MADKPKTVTTFDFDCIATIDDFKQLRPDIKSHSKAMEKLIQRAARIDLHRMTDEQFDALVDRISTASIR
jgi:hypothetical protein